MSLSTNGTTILKSFAELGSAIDLATLPPGSSDMADATTPTTTAADSAPTEVLAAETALKPTPNLAMLLARLAEMSSGLEAMARQDAQAREQATLQLAQYETLAAERREVERALAEARQVRLVAEQFVAQAFSDELRAQAAEQVAAARAAQLTCAELLAERTRAADELASRPQLARVLADRRRQAQARAEREQQQAAERTQRLAAGIDQAGQALCQEVPDQALAILRPLSAEFPDQPAGGAAVAGDGRLAGPAAAGGAGRGGVARRAFAGVPPGPGAGHGAAGQRRSGRRARGSGPSGVRHLVGRVPQGGSAARLARSPALRAADQPRRRLRSRNA